VPSAAMAARVLRRPQVDTDLDVIWRYIADDNMDAADRMLDRIGDIVDMLSDNPKAGRARPEIAPFLRSFPVGNYVVFYMALEDGVEIIRVLSGYQDVHTEDFE
jgi:toxin ParE1/3/4